MLPVVRVTWTGSHTVVLPALGLDVAPGGTVDVPEDVAESLLAQGFVVASSEEVRA